MVLLHFIKKAMWLLFFTIVAPEHIAEGIYNKAERLVGAHDFLVTSDDGFAVLGCPATVDMNRVQAHANEFGYWSTLDGWSEVGTGCFVHTLAMEEGENWFDTDETLAMSHVTLDGYTVHDPRLYRVQLACGAELLVSIDFVFDADTLFEGIARDGSVGTSKFASSDQLCE